MGAISIITFRFLSLYIGEEGKVFNLLAYFVRFSDTQCSIGERRDDWIAAQPFNSNHASSGPPSRIPDGTI